MGHTDKVIPNIELLHHTPTKTIPIPTPMALESETMRQLNEMQEAGIITRGISNWSAPMLLVKKKNLTPEVMPTYTLALDLRLLNSVIKLPSYPLPKISTIIQALSQFKYFSLLGLPNAYWQVNMLQQLQHLFSFTTPLGFFQF